MQQEAIEGLKFGDLVTHCEFNDLKAKVVSVDAGYCQVRIIRGWRGPIPTRPVRIPARRLVLIAT